jgi:hypothetical protein
MKILRSAIIFSFLFFNFTLYIHAQSTSRASIAWEVQKYDITATLPQNETGRDLNVKAVLSLKGIQERTGSRLTLRISDKATVSDVKINNSTTDFSKGSENISDNQNLQRIIVSLPSIPPKTTFNVEVNYKLNVKENSGLNSISPIGSQFLPLSFWYPTPTSWFFAGGADYAPFKVTINNVNEKMIVSSGTESGNSFEQKLNAQPFFLTGSWDVVAAKNENGVSVYMPKGAGEVAAKRAEEIAGLANEAKNFTANLLGNMANVPLRVVGVKRGTGFSSSGTIFVDDSAFLRQKLDSQTALTISEGVAKIWLGNTVKVTGDGYGVIREGLSRYIATEFLEQKYGKEVADIERLRQRVSYAAVVTRDSPLRIASPLDDYYFTSVANKGAMVWRLLAKKLGQKEFFEVIRSQMGNKELDLSEIRSAFETQKEFLDYTIDEVTDMNLMIGLPQVNGTTSKVALRNTGKVDVSVDVTAITINGERLTKQINIPAKSFGEAVFTNANKIVRTEIDSEKLYPQTNYADDFAPRNLNDSDEILIVKRAFDKQDYATAEKNARSVLQNTPHFDDARTWLARSLLAQGKTADAEKEFRTVLSEKLPTASSLAWANVGLGEIALQNGQKSQAVTYFEEAIKVDAEYGASLAARKGREKAGVTKPIDELIKNFFARFDKGAVSGRKDDIDALILSGEISTFARNIPGQAQKWETRVVQVDKLDENNVLVETSLNIQLIEKSGETGMAVFHLTKVGNNWKLNNVEMFEVR